MRSAIDEAGLARREIISQCVGSWLFFSLQFSNSEGFNLSMKRESLDQVINEIVNKRA